MTENNYAITLVLEYLEGDLMYKATVGKFPDVVVYNPSSMGAYREAIHVISDLIEMANDMGHPIPEPDYKESMMGKSNSFQWIPQQGFK